LWTYGFNILNRLSGAFLIRLLGAYGENNKNKNLTVQSSSAGDIKSLKTKTKVTAVKENKK
jgi:hypothetical protein